MRPRTRSSRTRQKTVNQREEIPEVTDSSSEVEYEYSSRPYMEYVERLPKRRETSDGMSVRSQYEEDREPDTVQSAEELDSDEGNDEESQGAGRDSDPDDYEIDLDAGRNAVKAPGESLSSRTEVNRVPSTRVTEKRKNKTSVEINI